MKISELFEAQSLLNEEAMLLEYLGNLKDIDEKFIKLFQRKVAYKYNRYATGKYDKTSGY
jgi:hypothetical protein